MRAMSRDSLRGGASAPAAVPKRSGLMGLWKKYEDSLDKEPLKTRIVSGFVISIIGDVICQYLTNGKGDKFVLDLKRMIVFACWGGFGFTPLATQWYGGMESVVPQTLPLRWLWKVVLDQTFFSTGMTALTFGMCPSYTPSQHDFARYSVSTVPTSKCTLGQKTHLVLIPPILFCQATRIFPSLLFILRQYSSFLL